MKKVLMRILCVAGLFVLICSCAKSGSPGEIVPPGGQQPDTTNNTVTEKPVLGGKLVFHRYVNYGETAQLCLYDFAQNKLTVISQDWTIFDPINAVFNGQGSQIVFMGQGAKDGKWNIYTWTIGSTGPPKNLTATDNCRDEDAHFSPDGTKICFKQTSSGGVGNVKVMDLEGNILQTVTSNEVESGMATYTTDASAILYARGGGSGSDIFMVNLDGSDNHFLAATVDVDEYYPVTLSADEFLYTRWYSSSNRNDQIYLGHFGTAERKSLPFNTNTADYSDACPGISNFIFLSSDKPGGSGAYDLYVADMTTGDIWSLKQYNAQINGSTNELGASYTP